MVFLDKKKNPKSIDGAFGQEEKSKKVGMVILEKWKNPKSMDGVFGEEGSSDLGTPWRPLSKSGITTNPTTITTTNIMVQTRENTNFLNLTTLLPGDRNNIKQWEGKK